MNVWSPEAEAEAGAFDELSSCALPEFSHFERSLNASGISMVRLCLFESFYFCFCSVPFSSNLYTCTCTALMAN